MSAGIFADIGLRAISAIKDIWSRDKEKIATQFKADSLVDYTKTCRVEPIMLVDSDCLFYDNMDTVSQSMLSIFAGYYLQAVAISMTIGKIQIGRTLEPFNPTRSTSGAFNEAVGYMLSAESYKDCLPTPEKAVRLSLEAVDSDDSYQLNSDKFEHQKYMDELKYNFDVDKFKQSLTDAEIDAIYKSYAKDLAKDKFEFDKSSYDTNQTFKEKEFSAKIDEAQRQYENDKKKFGAEKAFKDAQLKLQEQGIKLQQDVRNDKLKSSSFGYGKDTVNSINELSNLSVGKIFNVEITDGLHSRMVPISIRLISSSLPSNSMVHILSIGSKDLSFSDRWHRFKANRIEFWRDLVLCQDQIDDYRDNLMKDKDGVYSAMSKRNNANKLAGILSMNPSVATASNIAVISKSTADTLEMHLNGKLKDFRIRQKMMENTYLMLLVVIEKDWDRVTIYHRGINLATEVSIKDMKAANSGKGIDVGSVLSAYRAGSSPTI